MATLQQIYATLISGVAVASLSFGLFGMAVRFGYHDKVAPRVWPRPPGILLNVLKAPYACSWIPWSFRQSYPELMAGIPGTGTRQGGLAGPLLKVNLDGIIMLKYHVLLLKVSLFASILCMLVVLPITTTAKCDVELLGTGTCDQVNDLTDFEKTTIAHIPALQYNQTGATEDPSQQEAFVWAGNVSGRYVGIALVALAIYWYICHLLWHEWVENLALRRLFFLERDHYKERQDEWAELQDLEQGEVPPDETVQNHRHPWLPHPELRETVPNISLYSCLYRLPHRITTTDLPDNASDLERKLAATVDFFDQCVPNQRGFTSSVVAVTVLPEPAHVALAWKKWYRCGKKLRKLRYIRRNIQQRLEEMEEESERNPQQQKSADDECVIFEKKESEKEQAGSAVDSIAAFKQEEEAPVNAITEESKEIAKSLDILPLLEKVVGKVVGTVIPPDDETTALCAATGADNPSSAATVTTEMQAEKTPHGHPVDPGSPHGKTAAAAPRAFQYARFDVDRFAKQIGFGEETELDNLVANIGIEQLSVYAREYAQSSSNACPFGCGKEMIKYSSLATLREMEKEVMEQVKLANAELVEARLSVNRLTSGFIPTVDEPPDDAAAPTSYDPAASKKDDGAEAIAGDDVGGSDVRGAHDRNPSNSIRHRLASASIKTWNEAQALAGSIEDSHRMVVANTSILPNCMGTCARGGKAVISKTMAITKKVTKDDVKKVVNVFEHPTYAVVTFTSRQAAVAARQCLADGGGIDRWIEVEEVPVAPLADAPPWDIMFCRGCCRPVTLTISDREKKMRRCLGVSLFLGFCFFYTIPLALTSQLLNPEQLAALFPDSEALQNPDSFFFQVLAGISSGMLYTIFFSFCPQLFKAIANFEGNVSSKRTADDKALTYYWYFMLLTAFSGTSLTQMIAEVLFYSKSLAGELKLLLASVANSIPTQQAPVWMNWLVVRFTYTLPFMYLFQANTFGFSIIRWPWCGRLMRGGGPGGPPPYRIYVDSGTALVCVVAIAPTCPLIAPLALIYFCVMLVMLRWLLVFVYRPWYDAGGNKWPALHDIIISATIFGQVLLTTLLALSNAFVPAFMIAASIIPTYLFSQHCKRQFLRSYNDASLLQTSRLDGWDAAETTSRNQREEYRRWLVDSHKASYVPICLAGTESILTVEPAIVVSTKRDKEGSLRSRFVALKSQRGGRLNRFDSGESAQLPASMTRKLGVE